MTRWYVANYWSLRALKANTEKVMYRHRSALPSARPSPLDHRVTSVGIREPHANSVSGSSVSQGAAMPVPPKVACEESELELRFAYGDR